MGSDEDMTREEFLEVFLRLKARLAEHKRTEEALRASETRYRRLFEAARDGILILDAITGRITDVNPFLCEMLGFSREELVSRRLWEIGFFKDIESSKAAFDELLSQGYIRYENLPLETKSGRPFDVEFVSNVYLVGDEKVIQCNVRDVTARRKAEEKLKYLSTHDELTALHNRVFFEEEMSRLSRGRECPISVIVADVDGLKQINDELGHAVGDELLKRAASVLKETFRAEEVVARIGGDEFVVLLPKTDATAAELALGRARGRLQTQDSAETGPALSLSFGVATAVAPQSLAEALKRADGQMYREKVAHKLR